MRKPNAKQIIPGMIYTVTSNDNTLPFGMLLDQDGYLNGVKDIPVPIGTQIETVTAVYKGPSQRVDWRAVGSQDVYTSFWSIFKENTELMSGATATVEPVQGIPTNTGPYNGFDFRIKSVKFEDYTPDMALASINIRCEFLGGFTGAKKLPTKLITQIKQSQGFTDAWRTALVDVLNKHQDEMLAILQFTRNCDMECATTYVNGDIETSIQIGQSLADIRQLLDRHIPEFIQSKTTNTYTEN